MRTAGRLTYHYSNVLNLLSLFNKNKYFFLQICLKLCENNYNVHVGLSRPYGGALTLNRRCVRSFESSVSRVSNQEREITLQTWRGPRAWECDPHPSTINSFIQTTETGLSSVSGLEEEGWYKIVYGEMYIKNSGWKKQFICEVPSIVCN